MSIEPLDQAKSELFAEQMLGILNNGSVSLMTSIGHRTGLFDVMGGLAPSTSAQIAHAANLNERYVREWLGAMVTARIVEYDPVAQTYTLPPEHGTWLTRDAGPDNLAALMQLLPLLAAVEEEIIACFRAGGGVPYAAYPRFQRVMAEISGAIVDDSLVDTMLPLVPGIVEQLQAGIDVADIGCGSGHAINVMAKTFPSSRFTGYDFSDEGIETARAEATELGLSNAHFEVQDVAELDVSQQFDFITAFDTIHDQAKPARVLRAVAGALRPEGSFLMVDIAASSKLDENLDHIVGPYLYTVSTMHCMTVSLALDGRGLGTAWGQQKAQQMLADAGFADIQVKQIDSDPFNYYYIATGP